MQFLSVFETCFTASPTDASHHIAIAFHTCLCCTKCQNKCSLQSEWIYLYIYIHSIYKYSCFAAVVGLARLSQCMCIRMIFALRRIQLIYLSHSLSLCIHNAMYIYMYMFVCVKESDRQHKTSVNAHLNSPSALIRSCFLLYIVFSHTAQHLARMQTHKAGQTETATDDRRLQQIHIDVSMIYPNSYGEWVHKKTEYFSKV